MSVVGSSFPERRTCSSKDVLEGCAGYYSPEEDKGEPSTRTSCLVLHPGHAARHGGSHGLPEQVYFSLMQQLSVLQVRIGGYQVQHNRNASTLILFGNVGGAHRIGGKFQLTFLLSDTSSELYARALSTLGVWQTPGKKTPINLNK